MPGLNSIGVALEVANQSGRRADGAAGESSMVVALELREQPPLIPRRGSTTSHSEALAIRTNCTNSRERKRPKPSAMFRGAEEAASVI